MADLGIIILTHNEEKHIGRAVRAVSSIASEVVVVDSYSTDATVQIAREAGARVLQNRWINYAQQFQWAVDHAGLQTTWLMRLDADEVVEPDLAEEINRKLPDLGPDVGGIVLKRKHIFMGRFVRHGGRYPLYLLRIWRRGQAQIEQRWMDEHMRLEAGRAVVFEGGFADVNLNDLAFFVDKHNRYAAREAIDVLADRLGLFQVGEGPALNSQARWRRMLKGSIYNQLGLWGPMLYFLYRYIGQLGFLDGKEGLIYHFLQGGWYRFLVAAKVIEFERALIGLTSKAEILAALSEVSGLDLASAP